MTRSQKILLIFAAALVFIGALVTLTVIYREELRQAVSAFLLGGWQDLTHAWLSMGADLRWSIYIILLSVLLFLSFPSFQGSWQAAPTAPGESGVGRLAFWNNELRTLLEEGPVNRITVIELRRLALEVIGFRQQMSAARVSAWLMERLESGDPDIPSAMRVLVNPGAFKLPANPDQGSMNLIQSIRMLFSPPMENLEPALVLTPGQLDAIIRYLEQVLEGSYDNDNR